MTNRREFFKRAAMMSGGAGLAANLLEAIQRATAIDPKGGSTYLDAEHVVILMQENRSFDHCFGTLRGVRGFNDPRAVTLPNENPVWLQTNARGETYAPFRLNIKETKATWVGSLPHSWRDQTDAANRGNHDKWLDTKPSNNKECAGMPLTMGYYTREDVPFYYALADAFTVCDQHFCSSLTGTTPNRLYLWTGTVREHAGSPANVRNSDVTDDSQQKWTTFPERLEDAGISWRIYQNEVNISGFEGEHDRWLSNFSDNPIEWFTQYGAKFSKVYRERLTREAASLPAEIKELKENVAAAPSDVRLAAQLKRKEQRLQVVLKDRAAFTEEGFNKMSKRERSLHEKAFTTNVKDPSYRELATLRYRDGGEQRELEIPKGDVLHQFREDVKTGALPTVSWIVAPEYFSDHPSAPWYGQWYLAEVLNILTHNPEVWKKTIFVLTYDENDGYFDHVPPFAAPNPADPESGRVSGGIDASPDYWPLEGDLKLRSAAEARGGPIGLGFRVPMVVASPWSRGGSVCSQVFDHTSVLQFLEKILSHRTGKEIKEPNISQWRRTVCGDLSSLFKPFDDGSDALSYPPMNSVLEGVHKAKFKKLPTGFKLLSSSDIDQARRDAASCPWMPQQEKGIRPSCALPYELSADAKLSADRHSVELSFEAKNSFFGKNSSGAPFHVYAPGKAIRTRAYAVAAGQRLTDSWQLSNGLYHLRASGPNGFLREFAGSDKDPGLDIQCEYLRSGDIELKARATHACAFSITDHAYKNAGMKQKVAAGKTTSVLLKLSRSHSWYDFSIHVEGSDFMRRYAGRVETGKPGFSDPAMGRVEI